MSPDESRNVDAIIVGGGLSGIAAAIRLERDADIHDYVVIERADELGGTWAKNTYPGCACDVPSTLYSYEFAPNPAWSRVFAPQAEILAYVQDVARRHRVPERTLLNTEVQSATWDDDAQHWRVETSRGTYTAPTFVFAAGGLDAPTTPDVPGLDSFQGTAFHSAQWRHDHDLTGRRVAVIGTGASAIQVVPSILDRVEHLTVLQRTPVWVWPKPNWRTTRLERAAYRRFPKVQRAVRETIISLGDALVVAHLHRSLARVLNVIGRAHLRLAVQDGALRRALTPTYTTGCKRLLVDNGYYRAFAKPHVDLIPHALREVRANSIVAADGSVHQVDTIIWATGFETAPPPFVGRVFGRDGRSLEETWDGNPEAYMGTSIPGFPNAYMMFGPNAATQSITIMIEAQLNYITDTVKLARRLDTPSLDIRPEVVAAFKQEMRQALRRSTMQTGGCRSFFMDRRGDNYFLYGGTARSLLSRSKTAGRAENFHAAQPRRELVTTYEAGAQR